jgi:diguanylate cyclase (GGDEF)-like protein
MNNPIYLEQIKQLKQLKQLENRNLLLRLSLAMDVGNIGVWDWDLVAHETTWDEKMFEIYGMAPLIPMPYEKWINAVFPDDRPIVEASLQHVICAKETHKVDFRIIRPDGEIRYIHAAQGFLCDELGEITRVIGINIDVSEEMKVKEHLLQANEKLAALSYMDGLTGVANRRFYDERIKTEIASSKRSGSPLSLLMIDIDFFKQYNDNYGHIKGDDALKKIAICLSKSLTRETDIIARYGGEEFVVLLGNTPLQGAQKIAKRMMSNIQNENIEHSFSSVSSLLTVSIGISSTETSFNDIVEHADEALFKSKKQGRNRYEIY